MAEGGVKDRAGEAITRAKRRVGIENPSAADDEGNVGTVRGALRAFGEGDMDGFLDALNDDVTWEAPGGEFPGEEALDGRDAVRDKFVGDAGRTFTSFGFIPEKFLDADDENAVVVFGQFQGEGVDGESVSEPGAQVWQFSGTEAEHVRIYTDSAPFPENITEEKEKEREEEKRKKEEEEKKKEQEAKEEESSESESDDDTEGKDDDDSESKSESKDQTESKSDDDSESKGDDESKSKDDD
jgi:ketosteroid isomerase-like protein